jgi:hypothetical protein
MRKLFFLFLPLGFAIVSCNNQASTDITSDSSGKNPVTKIDSTSSDWRSLTESWATSLDMKNASIMKSFYADTVAYYGDKISGETVVKRQNEYFANHPKYKMKLEEYVSEEQQPDGSWKIRITKRVTNDSTADYPASLIYAKRNGIWKIISESDDITDIKKAQAAEVQYEPEVVTIEGLMEENTGFGANTTGGDPKSDNKEKYFVIWPSQPLNVIATPTQQKEGLDVTENDVDRLQLIGDDKMIQPLLNKKVRITGTLTHGISAHHFTKVLINVTSIQEVK